MSDEPKIETRTFLALDTGIGREAGYANDAELIEAGKRQREELRQLLTPEAFARFEAAEAEAERAFLFGDASPGGDSTP